jgi:hypothetical protein
MADPVQIQSSQVRHADPIAAVEGKNADRSGDLTTAFMDTIHTGSI